MKKLTLSLFVAVTTLILQGVTLLALPACPTDDGPGEGEGERGDEGEGEANEGEGDNGGEGEGGGTDGVVGDSCTDDSGCATGFVCGSFFTDPNIDKGCVPSCTEAAAACTVIAGLEGTCQEFANFSSPICVAESGLLGLCGNGISALCATGVSCGLAAADNPATPFDDSIVGLCIVPCSAAGACTDVALDCSNDFQVDFGGGPVGVCVEPTTLGDTCGANADFSTTVCTGEQDCQVAQGAATGTCVAEGGGGEGEGEGEGDAG